MRCFDRPYASTTPPFHTRNDGTHIQDAAPLDDKGPTTGRATRMGRKAEKPRDPKAGGPSGQTERAKHNKKHANK